MNAVEDDAGRKQFLTRRRIEVQRFCFTFRACHDLQLSSARRRRTLHSPRLNCQQDGVEKKPLSKEGFEGKNLFWDARKLFLFQQDYKSKPSMYLGRLVDMLMGVRGTNSVRQRRKERGKYPQIVTRQEAIKLHRDCCSPKSFSTSSNVSDAPKCP